MLYRSQLDLFHFLFHFLKRKEKPYEKQSKLFLKALNVPVKLIFFTVMCKFAFLSINTSNICHLKWI